MLTEGQLKLYMKPLLYLLRHITEPEVNMMCSIQHCIPDADLQNKTTPQYVIKLALQVHWKLEKYTVCKLGAHFRARFAPMIWANCAPLNVWGGGDYYIGANQAGKRARSLFNCISVTDGIKINEQNKSIGIGPLYLHSEFEAI